jgi:hypothetical protein
MPAISTLIAATPSIVRVIILPPSFAVVIAYRINNRAPGMCGRGRGLIIFVGLLEL